MRSILFLVLAVCSLRLGAQDTLFYNKAKQQVATIGEATYMDIIRCAAANPMKCNVATMLIDSNRIVASLRYADYEKKILQGRCSFWLPNGQLHHEIMYENGKKQGPEKYFYSVGTVRKTLNWEQDRLVSTSLHHFNGAMAMPKYKEEPDQAIFDDEPTYPEGEKALFRFLSEKVVYPESMKRKGIDGAVVISFMVETDGKLTDIKVLATPHKDLTEALLQVVSKMPAWIPAKQNGQSVKAKYVLPFRFALM